MDNFFKGLNISISTFCVCADGFQGLSKAFHYSLQTSTSYLLLRNYLQILKIITKTLLCDWLMFSNASLPLAAGKMRKNKLFLGGFR
jgi:hypothetical protein